MSSQKVKDPVCGMMVDPKTAVRLVIDNHTYYLCSQRCAEQLKAKKVKR